MPTPSFPFKFMAVPLLCVTGVESVSETTGFPGPAIEESFWYMVGKSRFSPSLRLHPLPTVRILLTKSFLVDNEEFTTKVCPSDAFRLPFSSRFLGAQERRFNVPLKCPEAIQGIYNRDSIQGLAVMPYRTHSICSQRDVEGPGLWSEKLLFFIIFRTPRMWVTLLC